METTQQIPQKAVDLGKWIRFLSNSLAIESDRKQTFMTSLF